MIKFYHNEDGYIAVIIDNVEEFLRDKYSFNYKCYYPIPESDKYFLTEMNFFEFKKLKKTSRKKVKTHSPELWRLVEDVANN